MRKLALSLAICLSLAGFEARADATAGAQASGAFVPQRVGPGSSAGIEAWPDFRGRWVHDGPTADNRRLMFDPYNVVVEPDPAGEVNGIEFGPTPGTHLSAIPYKPQYRKQYDQTVARAKQGFVDDEVGVCKPYGMPRVMAAAPRAPFIIMIPGAVVMLMNEETRFIYLDGRPHPTGDDLFKSWEGHSIGRWDGDTLVVDTVDIRAGNYDQTNPRHSDQIHVVERLRLLDANTLENQMTIEDPVMLTRPWKVTRIYKRGPAELPDMRAFMCPANTTVELTGAGQKLILPSEKDSPANAK